jgi:hypothetical protein
MIEFSQQTRLGIAEQVEMDLHLLAGPVSDLVMVITRSDQKVFRRGGGIEITGRPIANLLYGRPYKVKPIRRKIMAADSELHTYSFETYD